MLPGPWARSSAAPIALALALGLAGAALPAWGDDASLALSAEPRPLATDAFPARPGPLFELGNPFLQVGSLSSGIHLPTGAVWQPSLLLFGGFRSALQTFEDATAHTSQWMNRLDLFANVAFTPTERLLVGFRPMDREGHFTGMQFGDATQNSSWKSQWNGNIQTLFFEGDFGEMFPGLDHRDRRPLDLGFAVGRQPIAFQDGLLIQDNIDAIGITRNSLRPGGISNLRVTGLWAWNHIHRGDNRVDDTANLFGVFTETDLRSTTLGLDAAVVASRATGDAFFAGLSATQRLRRLNTSFHLEASLPFGGPTAATGRGALLVSELSWSSGIGHNMLYLNSFLAVGRFTSAARDPLADGPMARAGILFSGVGLGRYGAILSSAAEDAIGGAFGYQIFFDDTRRQLLFELGGRLSTRGDPDGVLGLAARFEQALGRRYMVRIDGFVAAGAARRTHVGARSEFLVKF